MANWRRKLYDWKIRNLAYSMGFGIFLLNNSRLSGNHAILALMNKAYLGQKLLVIWTI